MTPRPFVVIAGLLVAAGLQAQQPPAVADLLRAIPFRLIGPSAPSGRVWQVVGVPGRPKVFYACTAEGGVWRTTNDGTTIAPVFEEENGAVCGAVAVAPSNPDHVWVGSGEPAGRQSNGLGYGVWKSTDGGATWRHVGLERTEQIGAVVIDPRNPDVVYVAAMGHLWGTNPERGVFKTTDGGRTWAKVLFVDDMTGAIDLKIDPHDPDVLYVSTWQRLRSGAARMRESGPGSGIFKSTDAGATWTRLTRGLPEEPLSKITLAVARHARGRLFAYILSGEPRRGGRTSDAGGVFRSDDGGATWRRVSPKLASRTYYTHIAIDPNDDDRLWILDLRLWRSDDGGATWVEHNSRHVHADLHSLWIDPSDSDHLVLAGDGGVNVSNDGGATWFQAVMPLGQFYEVDTDGREPYFVYGGMQDTASWAGPSATYDNEGITDRDWIKLRSVGDGMAIHPDPRDPDVVFLAQNNGNLSRLDLRTWTRTELQPEAGLADELGLHPFRWDWSPPFILDARDPDVLYVGANYVFRCETGEVLPSGEVDHACRVISPDLTALQAQPYPEVGERYYSYGALFSLAQSPVDPTVLWAGADDGPIHVSRDDGRTWTRVDGSLPPGTYREGFVSKIEPSRTGAGTAYVTFDLHYRDDPRPYVFRTADFGATWTDITSDLPVWGSTYVIREDPHNPRVLYVGTESGLFVSIDAGAHWLRWRGDLPATAVRSLAVQPRDRDLVVGTFGRSIWIADVSIVEQIERAIGEAVYFFEVEPTVAYNVRYTYGTTIEELNGDRFFRAANPPYGATFSYFLREPVAGGVSMAVSDGSGRVVAELAGPSGAGLHQVQWNLETDVAEAATGSRRADTLSERQRARRVRPGVYTATLRAGGVALTRPVEVRAEK